MNGWAPFGFFGMSIANVIALAHDELVMNERTAKIIEDRTRLRSCSMHYLRMEVKRSHKVFDTSGMSKASLILQILTDNYGAKAVAIAFDVSKA